jgi:hypothetical protein
VIIWRFTGCCELLGHSVCAKRKMKKDLLEEAMGIRNRQMPEGFATSMERYSQ